MLIKAVSYNGKPPIQPLVGEFGEAGGVIGRSDGNALVLPDPERYVSRAHATIAYRGGSYVIRDLSSASPVMVNGRPLGNGNEAQLLDGDELRIGAYTLQVIGDAPRQGAPVDDPLSLFGATGPLAPAAATAATSADFGLFAAALAPRPAAEERANPRAEFELGQSVAGDINQMFGLGTGAGNAASLFPAGHPLAAESAPGNMTGSVDPLVVMGAALAPPPTAPSQRDDAPEIRGSFVPPLVALGTLPHDGKSMLISWEHDGEHEDGDGIKTMTVPSAPRKARREPAPEIIAASMALPFGANVPAEAEFPASREVPAAANASAQTGAPAAPAVSVQLGAQPPADVAVPDQLFQRGEPEAGAGTLRATRAADTVPPSAARQSSGDNGELLAAFLAGAGVPDLEMKGPLDALTMQMLGHLLREATQGTLDLLLSRALMKREIRAEMTMIVPQENNPLKFSPNVEVALQHLLAPRGQGFMPPLPAMKDAYDDLRAHQFAFMAGMRAALAGVLERFNPERLEQRLSDRSVVDTLLPMNRKARLWSQYSELFAEINREAEDDFHSLFGKAFLAAYQAQLDRLQQESQHSSH